MFRRELHVFFGFGVVVVVHPERAGSHMKIKELTWAAGLLEGEGCFREKHTQNRKGGSNYYYPHIQCNMTDEDVIRKLHDTVGVGTVSGPHFRGKNKPSWTWQVTGGHAASLMLLLRPYMGERRTAKIDHILNAYNVITH